MRKTKYTHPFLVTCLLPKKTMTELKKTESEAKEAVEYYRNLGFTSFYENQSKK